MTITSNLLSLRVALRKESVDRNENSTSSSAVSIVSLSARRAWIEIAAGCGIHKICAVALRKESVDRNSE